MAVTANYETVMIVSMKKGEEGIQAIVEKFKNLIEKHATLKNVDEWGKRKLRKAKAITFSLILRAQPSSPRSLTVSTRSQKASCVPSSSRRKTNNHIVGYIPNYERTKK